MPDRPVGGRRPREAVAAGGSGQGPSDPHRRDAPVIRVGHDAQVSVETWLLLALGAVAVIVVVRWVADRTGLPAAALLVLIGIAYAQLPGPNVVIEDPAILTGSGATIDPDLVLTLVIPPLLYSAALESSLIDIRRHLRTVVSLSVLLVLVTALLVGLGFSWWVSGATLAAGVALGAAVAPPDPVAALAVGRRVGLPPRLVTLIQGEGLLNDATALTLLTVAVAAARGQGFSLPAASGLFVLTAAGGIAVGVAVALFVRFIRPITRDPLTANAVSLATPFAAYLIGEELHVSGVLAVVTAGLVIGHYAPQLSTGAIRLQTTSVWRLADFLLEGVVFLLIGQQLPDVIDGLSGYDTSTIVVATAVSLGVVLLLRPAWLTLTQLLPSSMHAQLGDEGGGSIPVEDGPRGPRRRRRSGRPDELLGWREILVLSWSGTRGVITLAAILTLPKLADDGSPFPDRDLLVFCAFVVVLVTLVGQGLTFAPLVRALGLRADKTDQALLRNQARTASVEAALARLDEIASDPERRQGTEEAVDLSRRQLNARLARYRGRLSLLEDAGTGTLPVSPAYETALRVRRDVIDAQREELLRWRDTGRLPDEGLRVLERELDHEELLLPDRPRDR